MPTWNGFCQVMYAIHVWWIRLWQILKASLRSKGLWCDAIRKRAVSQGKIFFYIKPRPTVCFLYIDTVFQYLPNGNIWRHSVPSILPVSQAGSFFAPLKKFDTKLMYFTFYGGCKYWIKEHVGPKDSFYVGNFNKNYILSFQLLAMYANQRIKKWKMNLKGLISD